MEKANIKTTNRQLIPFIVASFLLFFSIILGPKIMGVGLILWFCTLTYTMQKLLFKNYSVKQFLTDLNKRTSDLFRDKKYFESSIYALTTPLLIIGIAVLLMIIIMLFFI